MTSSFFYLQAEKNSSNRSLIDSLEEWSSIEKSQVYVIDRPLGDEKYRYNFDNYLIILSPKHKITFIDYSNNENFEDFIEDFIEDLGSISDKYRYKESIGRPKSWKNDLVATYRDIQDYKEIEKCTTISDIARQRIVELLISLLTGSINDISRVHAELPQNLLEKVKRKILLFDGDQTRFVYQKLEKSPIYIQGLSGTGKTELLMHKLKDLYIGDPDTKIVMTCHNRILADSLSKRIPDFFNFMKVEQQIKWQERLWCMHAWGSGSNPNSGTYRYICYHYGIPFQTYSSTTTFDKICRDALTSIDASDIKSPPFDYILIDESQDFPESFIDLCAKACRKTVFVAGDIFQSIFADKVTDTISPDFLLSKCYRTDPKTLMFAHSLGMALFEPQKLRWLEDEEWKKCGYIVNKSSDGLKYLLSREPLRRFEDLDKEDYNCVEIIPTQDNFVTSSASAVVSILQQISADNPTVTPDDVGIILLDSGKHTYRIADILEQLIPRSTGWSVNKAYETKQRVAGTVFVSNRNNVKGLEFPFVICVTQKIGRGYAYRNSAYMTLTRSFLRSYIVLSEQENTEILPQLTAGLEVINERGCIIAQKPSDIDREGIQTAIRHSNNNESFFDIAQNIFDEIGVLPLFRTELLEVIKKTLGDEFDVDSVREIATFNYGFMQSRSQ